MAMENAPAPLLKKKPTMLAKMAAALKPSPKARPGPAGLPGDDAGKEKEPDEQAKIADIVAQAKEIGLQKVIEALQEALDAEKTPPKGEGEEIMPKMPEGV